MPQLALYGSQGANGVILLSLKKVKEGSSSLNICTTFEFGFHRKFQNNILPFRGEETWEQNKVLMIM
jgi:hypothetical protein